MIRHPLPDGFWLVILAAVVLGWIAGECLGRFIIWRDDRAMRAASVDTLPKGQDAKQGLAGTEGSAVGEAETP